MKLGRSIDEFSVGMRREFSRTFTAEDTQKMGDLIGDHNLFHYPGPFIEKTRFKKPIVHGLLIGGMICHFGGDIFPGPGYLAELMQFKFLEPVYFGETIKAVGTVVEVNKKRRGVVFEMECFNQDGVKVAEAEVVGIPFQIEIEKPE
jgi:3-hydroxybutyryl-CoA dehydratase